MNNKNSISLLQEFCQCRGWDLPDYQWEEVPGLQQGQPHFRCSCTIQTDLNCVPSIYKTDEGYPSKTKAKKAVAEIAYEDQISPRPSRRKVLSGSLAEADTRTGESADKTGQIEGKWESTSWRTIVLVDLENLPHAGKYKYPSDVGVILVLSHNHSFYCGPAGDFLDKLPFNVRVEVVRSSLKDAADHYLTWLAATLVSEYRELSDLKTNSMPNFLVVSRDVAGACTAECLKMSLNSGKDPGSDQSAKIEHITNLRDLESALM